MVRGNILDKMVGKDAQIHLSRDPSEDFEKPWKQVVQAEEPAWSGWTRVCM